MRCSNKLTTFNKNYASFSFVQAAEFVLKHTSYVLLQMHKKVSVVSANEKFKQS